MSWAAFILSTFVIMVLVILFLCSFGVVVVVRSGGSKKSLETADEDAQTYQEMYRGFQRMEDRIEALETILMDKGGRSSRGSRSGSDSFE